MCMVFFNIDYGCFALNKIWNRFLLLVEELYLCVLGVLERTYFGDDFFAYSRRLWDLHEGLLTKCSRSTLFCTGCKIQLCLGFYFKENGTLKTMKVPSALTLRGHLDMGDSHQLLWRAGRNSSISCLPGGCYPSSVWLLRKLMNSGTKGNRTTTRIGKALLGGRHW